MKRLSYQSKSKRRIGGSEPYGQVDKIMATGDEWKVLQYEWNMVRLLPLYLIEPQASALEQTLKNAVVESLVLHTRILTELLLSSGTKKDDIRLTDLLPNLQQKHVADLRLAYGGQQPSDPKWQFDKILAHATTHRSDTHNYVQVIKTLWPYIEKIMEDVKAANPPIDLE